MELELAASTVEVSDTGIVIGWSDGRKSRFHALWLRDNCPSAGGRTTGSRTFSITDINPELFVLDAERSDDGGLLLEFSDGHESTFDFDWLQANSPEAHDRLGAVRRVEHFRAGVDLRQFDLPRNGSSQHGDLLDAVSRDGAAIVNGLPADEAGTELLASLFGRVRETQSGTMSDLVMEAVGWEFGDAGLAIDPHTIDSFRYAPPGVSIAHCVTPPAAGGEWTLVDGFAVAEELSERYPDEFDVLIETSVPFVRHRDASDRGVNPVHLLAHGPVLSLDRDREISGVRFDEGSMAPIDIEPRLVGDYYRALITFAKAVHDPSRALVLALRAGQAVVVDNHRVLQGRTALGTAGDGGHVRMCGIERDQFHSRLRELRAQHDRPHVNERLPAGVTL